MIMVILSTPPDLFVQFFLGTKLPPPNFSTWSSSKFGNRKTLAEMSVHRPADTRVDFAVLPPSKEENILKKNQNLSIIIYIQLITF